MHEDVVVLNVLALIDNRIDQLKSRRVVVYESTRELDDDYNNSITNRINELEQMKTRISRAHRDGWT